MTIGERIKIARENKGLTQEQLGVMCGTTKQTIFKYETGVVTNIPLDRLKRIAEVLSVTPAYLMGWSETTPAITEKDERDIAKDLERIMTQLDAGGDLMFDGDPMSDEARESIRAAMKLGLEAAKVKNKERFTPKNHRKE